jgi:hypothetical protein
MPEREIADVRVGSAKILRGISAVAESYESDARSRR